MTAPGRDWSADEYLRFERERTRASHDLLARIPIAAPGKVVDIGCGPGNSTELLVQRWPAAAVSGFDTSPAMLEAARKRVPGAAFFEADAASWTPDRDCDVLFANAVFQWIPDNLAILATLLTELRPGSVLAVQVPDNLDEGCHVAMGEIAAESRWRDRLGAGSTGRPGMPTPREFHERLGPLASQLDVWVTTYQHLLAGIDSIVEWMRSTGLRPFLAPLDAEERAAFLGAYRRRLEAHYRPLPDGTVLLPFPRLFLVAQRG